MWEGILFMTRVLNLPSGLAANNVRPSGQSLVLDMAWSV